MRIRKSWLFTSVLSVGCAALSAGVNFLGSLPSSAIQPPAVAWIHVGAAFFGAFCLARFVVGAPAAMAGPPPKSILASAEGAQREVYKFRVSSKGHFFSLLRGGQLLAVLLCLMIQFVSVAAPASASAPERAPSYCPIPSDPGQDDAPGDSGRAARRWET
jgi:hypothetical protein